MAKNRYFLHPAAAAAALVVAPLIAAQPHHSSDSMDRQDQFTDWSEPVSIGPPANTEFDEFGTTISRDGLSLYFHSGRPGGFGGTDIWVSQRASQDDPWGPASNLGPAVNTQFNENTPRLALDGHRLYFASDRPGGLGGSDLYVSRRFGKRDDLAWHEPENLGGVNSSSNDGGPAIFEDDATGTTTLYFQSPRPGGLGAADIYASTLQPDESFGPAALVEELSSSGGDMVPSIRGDGLEMIITSNRAGSLPFPPPFTGRSFDLWVSTRATTDDPWSVPVNMGAIINTNFNDGWTALSFDAMTLYFSSVRADQLGELTLDIYMSTRSKLR